jgi:hypothetical protein
MKDRQPKYETVGIDVIKRLDALVQASGRTDTECCGLSGEILPRDVKPAIRHSNDDRIGRAEEILVEASPVGV